MRFSLYFDGACSPNPGRGGCGAVVYRNDGTNEEREVWREGCSLGEGTTNNIAEYSGLLVGLIGILRKLPRGPHVHQRPESVHVQIYGDSELVIRQMTGAYEIRNRRLRLMNTVAKGLASRFAGVRFHHIGRDANQVADDVAKRALHGNCTTKDSQRLIWYPNLAGFTRARVNSSRTNASDDRIASCRMPHVLIDASYLASLPSHGIQCLRSLSQSPYQVCGAGMLVLGTLTQDPLHLDILDFEDPDDVRIRCVIRDAIVVDNLPTPLHISYDHPAIGGPFATGKGFTFDMHTSLEVGLFPAEYAEHPYWRPGKIYGPAFIGQSETSTESD